MIVLPCLITGHWQYPVTMIVLPCLVLATGSIIHLLRSPQTSDLELMSKPLKFHLVHRDDRDPLSLDENSSEYVLQLIDTTQGRRRPRSKPCSFLDPDSDSIKADRREASSVKSSITLPASTLASQVEEKSEILARNELITGAIYDAPEDVII